MSVAILLGSGGGAALGILAVETELPLFLDSIGTAVVAALFGAFPGMLTGLLTNYLADLFNPSNPIFLSFAPVNMVTGFLVGYVSWRFDLSRPGTVAALIALVTFANVLLGTATVVWLHSGTTATSIDYLVTALVLTGRSLFSSAFLARIPTNLVDKTIALFAAYGAYRWAFTPFRVRGG
ncbi:MAG: ECF transporter S component, partial [Gammaproteobacteria bacterium]|nr:ECF transporter S component [Gammaproteobacteria bacterium]